MLLYYISVFLVNCVFYVDSQNGNNNNRDIATTLIGQDGAKYPCPYPKDVVLRDGENITVEMTHISYINIAYVILPSKEEINITGDNPYEKTKKFQISPKNDGKWSFSTLTDKGTSNVPDKRLRTTTYKNQTNETYYEFLCKYNIKVEKKPEDEPKRDNNWIYYVVGGSVLAIIIVIQTIVILYILKTRKIRRIEQLALSNTRNASDTARYSTTPGRKASVKPKPDEDAGSIYESLDVLQTPANDAPPPPPIETLPRPPKKDKVPLLPSNSSQLSTPILPRTEDEKIRNRPPMPLPGESDGATPPFPPQHTGPAHPRTESNISVTMRGPAKSKMAAFVPAQIPPTPDRAAPKMTRKPSAVNQDPLSNELNNILKKRQTGNIPPKPNKPLEVAEPIPETKPKTPFPTPQGLRPPVMSKPTTPMTPAKQLPRPVAPKNVAGLPRPPVSPTQKPLLSPKPGPVKKWPPVNPPGSQPLPTPQTHGNPSQRLPHPISQQHPIQHSLAPRPVPVLPADGVEEAEYAEYEYNDDDDDEWTYEPLPHDPEHNIYMNASATNAHG